MKNGRGVCCRAAVSEWCMELKDGVTDWLCQWVRCPMHGIVLAMTYRRSPEWLSVPSVSSLSLLDLSGDRARLRSIHRSRARATWTVRIAQQVGSTVNIPRHFEQKLTHRACISVLARSVCGA